MGEGECAYWDVLTFPARKQVDRIRYPVTKTALETVDKGGYRGKRGAYLEPANSSRIVAPLSSKISVNACSACQKIW